MNIAIYDAVVTIHGRYEPYALHARRPANASDVAAVAAAAHHVLETYSPYAQAALDTEYATALAAIPNGGAKTRGIALGTRSANRLIALRVNDGRNGPTTFDLASAPGVWRPTTPGVTMFVPWMGGVKPLVLRSAVQFGEPGPPPALTSDRYTRDFNEVKRLGGATGSQRTARQTAVATFFSGNAQIQFTGALIDQAEHRNLDIVDTARLFAAVDTSIADGLIAIWHSKLHYGFWRPVTAINLADTDGNNATAPDTSWVPLLTTPPYPDYVSGYSGVAGAFTRALQKVLGTTDLDITLRTSIPTLAGVTRRYDRAADLNRDVVNARIWLGIHFRFADTAGITMGQRAATYVLGHAFERLDD
jgi:hypothetical protein